MDERIMERYDLVRERLAEIRSEQSSTAHADGLFWCQCASLALGEPVNDLQFADFGRCRRMFGSLTGMYCCILFTQLLMVPRLKWEGKTELCCICSELTVELFLMCREEENASAVRDTMYWFYSDYCEQFIRWQMEQIMQGGEFCFGGPMMLWNRNGMSREQEHAHRNDFGLYMGNRFQERCYHAVTADRKIAADAVRRWVAVLKQWSDDTGENACAVSVTDAQKQAMERLCSRLEAWIVSP